MFEAKSKIKVKLKPVSNFLIDRVIGGRPVIMPPTYEAKTVAGDTEVHAYTAEMPKNEAEQEAWDTYVLTRTRAEQKFVMTFMRVLVMEGTLPEFKSKDYQEWESLQKTIGLELPEEGLARWFAYFTEKVIDSEEIPEFIAAVLAESGVSREVVNQLKASFRNSPKPPPAE